MYVDVDVDIFRGGRQKLSLYHCRDSDRFSTIVYLKNMFYTPHRNKMATLQQSGVNNCFCKFVDKLFKYLHLS